MGIIDRFEKSIERAVNGAFAKAFRSQVQPIELVSGIRRECDSRAAVVGRDRTLVPNAYTIHLATSDHERFVSWESSLADELAASLNEHARQQGYSFVGPVMIRFVVDSSLSTGVFHVTSAQQKGTMRQEDAGIVGESREPVLDVNGRLYQLTNERTLIGRGGDADIVVEDTGASRHHCQITIDNGRLMLRDLGSMNGTFVDGRRVESIRLTDGNVITIGRARIVVNVREMGTPGR